MRNGRTWIAACVMWLLCALPARADGWPLSGGERIIFFGDSITASGAYITYFEAYLLTRFPNQSFEVINHGISSETISGTSEPDHNPRRPHADVRFTRDITGWKPTLVVACFGMNDGNYHPFDEERFALYQAGVRRLRQRTNDEAHGRLVLLTPPPFDPYQRKNSDPQAIHFGYKYPAVDYDQTLTRYANWLLTLRPEQEVVDVHELMNAHLRRRRETRVSFALAPDSVHPDATGHWLMAQALLAAWQAPAVVSEVTIDGGERKLSSTGSSDDVTDFEPLPTGGFKFTWRTRLPLPIDPQWDAESIALEDVSGRLSRWRLKIDRPAAARYRLVCNGQGLAEWTSAELQAGVDLTRVRELPPNVRSLELLKKLQARNGFAYAEWRKSLAANPQAGPGDQNLDAAKKLAALTRELDELRQPMRLSIELATVPN